MQALQDLRALIYIQEGVMVRLRALVWCVAVLLLPVADALADWDVEARIINDLDAQGKAVIEVVLTADANPWTFVLKDELGYVPGEGVKGLYVYRLKSDPGDGVASAYTITLTDPMDSAVLTDRSTTAPEVVRVSDFTSSGAYLSFYGGLIIEVTSPGEGERITFLIEGVR